MSGGEAGSATSLQFRDIGPWSLSLALTQVGTGIAPGDNALCQVCGWRPVLL
jgi:hypothetical protein